MGKSTEEHNDGRRQGRYLHNFADAGFSMQQSIAHCGLP